MYFKLFPIFIFLFIFFECKFIELRIYPPIPRQTSSLHSQSDSSQLISGNSTQIKWIDETGLDDKLGYHNPFIFKSRTLENRYGDLASILKNEVEGHPNRYMNFFQSGWEEVKILTFQLESEDRCFSNTVSVRFSVELRGNGKKKDFLYEDSIQSNVTDCYLVGSGITLVPLLFYTPYVGFRGNREDQFNQLGRNAIGAFLEYLQGGD